MACPILDLVSDDDVLCSFIRILEGSRKKLSRFVMCSKSIGCDSSRAFRVWRTPHAAEVLDLTFVCGGRDGAHLAPGERPHEMDRSMNGGRQSEGKHTSSAACNQDSTDGPGARVVCCETVFDGLAAHVRPSKATKTGAGIHDESKLQTFQ
jgi:hypothetical protein